MPDYLLDTNIVKYWYATGCPEHAKVGAHIQAVRQPDSQSGYVSRLFISTVTLGEIEYGHRAAPSPDIPKQQDFIKFVRDQCPEQLEIVTHVTEHYGELRAWLFKNCSPKHRRAKWPEELLDPTTAKELGVQENDIWIAAQAITHNLVLVTHDSRGNFGILQRQFASTLHLEDWAQ